MARSQSLWIRISDLLTGRPVSTVLDSTRAVTPDQRGVRTALDGRTLELRLGDRCFHVSPRLPIVASAPAPSDELIVLRSEAIDEGISDFMSMHPGDVLSIGPDLRRPHDGASHPGDSLQGDVQLRHEGNTFVIKPTPEVQLEVRAADHGQAENALHTRRRHVLSCMREGLGDSFAPYAEQALERLRAVIHALDREPSRALDANGRPGAIVRLDPDTTPVLVGDLHGRTDNLLSLLSHNGYWDGLEAGTVALIILGDAVHPDEGDDLGQMADSVATMDLILALKWRYPDSVHFLPGNHDDFSPELMKNGFAQGLLWSSHLIATRGVAYREEMQRFYEACPVIATSKDFAACHAGPPRTSYTLEMLENAHHHPHLHHELRWNRQQSPGYAHGYTRDDVDRLRKTLGLEPDATFVVGHYPRSPDGAVWLNVGGIAHHHVLISSRRDRVAAITRLDGAFVAQTYPAEAVAAWMRSPDASEPRPGGQAVTTHAEPPTQATPAAC